jgi:hypothetical protein
MAIRCKTALEADDEFGYTRRSLNAPHAAALSAG